MVMASGTMTSRPVSSYLLTRAERAQALSVGAGEPAPGWQLPAGAGGRVGLAARCAGALESAWPLGLAASACPASVVLVAVACRLAVAGVGRAAAAEVGGVPARALELEAGGGELLG